MTTATDVYALGVLLYELLVGRHPTASKARSDAEVVRALLEDEPVRPSEVATRLHAADPDAARIVEERRTTVHRLQRACRGDLDTIVGTALKKQVAERYASVTAFADDLRRHLRHEPIAARPDSAAYRGARFVRRNRLAVAAALAVVVSLSAGLYAANRQRAAAERRFQQVRQLANRVLALDSDIRALPGSTKARHEIVSMAKEYLEALRPDAEADPDLALEIGVAYSQLALAQGVPTTHNLGQYDQAAESLRRADALLELVLAASPANRLALLESAEVAHGRMILADMGRRREDALTQARKSGARLDALLGAGPATVQETEQATQLLNNIALAHKNAGLYPEAIAYAHRALAIVPAVRRKDELCAQGWSIIADAQRLSGDLDGALHAIHEARTRVGLAHFPGEGAKRSTTFNVLWREGLILGEEGRISLGRTDEAIDVLQWAFDTIEGWARQDADDAMSRGLFASAGRELGDILRRRDPRRALAIYDRALVRLGEVKDNAKARRDEVELWVGSAAPLQALGRSADARQRLDTAFARLRQLGLYPTNGIELGSEADTSLRALADYEAETGNVARAIETYQQLLDGVQAAAPAPETSLTDAADLSRLYGSMALLHRRVGQADVASELDARRLQVWQHWDTKLPNNPFVTVQLAAARVE